jgi:hypothetical protein
MTKEQFFKEATGDLSRELARMHAVLFNLIAALRETELSSDQAEALKIATYELGKSQGRFFAKYADMAGGAKPENN